MSEQEKKAFEPEMNDDGTATCSVCGKDKPPKGFECAMTRWQTYDEPAEYGQICPECIEAALARENEMESEYTPIDDDIPSWEEEMNYKEQEHDRMEAENNNG